MEVLHNMLSAGRLIRLLILVLACVAVWKVWDYVVLGDDSPSKDEFELPQPVMDSNVKNANSPKIYSGLPPGLEELNIESASPGLHVEVFYEPLCPDSRYFVRNQLSPAIDLLSDAVDLHMVPYGKAKTYEEAGKLSFHCQHGPVECVANKIHGCVVHEVKEQRKQLKIIDCMITDNYKPKAAGEKCVTDHAGPKVWASVQECYTSKTGDQILKHMGTMTNSLEPSVSFIPTITINKSQDDQNYILQDFTKALCKRFKIGVPDACASHRS